MNVIRFSDLIAAGKVSGQRVFIRADLNVPQDDNGGITDDTRIRASVPAIEHGQVCCVQSAGVSSMEGQSPQRVCHGPCGP